MGSFLPVASTLDMRAAHIDDENVHRPFSLLAPRGGTVSWYSPTNLVNAPPFEPTSSHAPGWPGIAPRWTSSVKNGVGTALDVASRVWFTLSHGILDEIYYPRVDSACTRDLGLIVTDGASYFSEEKRDTQSEVSLLAPGVPAFHLRNVARDGRYIIEKDVLTDTSTHVVLQRTRFGQQDA